MFANAHDKWIVVTTIQYPTPALKKLASLSDWRLVVVADKKTPSDWYLENCIFLSVQAQQELPYKIIKFLPWNHYSRKNIGYLYAIEHGASIIYETDDDNYLLNGAIVYLPEHTMLSCYVHHNSVINPYAYFGQPSVWPRGYPLSAIMLHNTKVSTMKYATIPIQQGLVNNDPDVDAIFRLTQGREIFFDAHKAPIGLSAYTMCPFNSQNTLFYASAFWGLLLPITARFRVCDIWRSYWVQRMLWDIDGSLCFLPPTAIQYRNEHDSLKDFADELDIYLKTERLIELLIVWHSEKHKFVDRIQELMKLLIEQGFFKAEEQALVDAWFKDLSSLNYTMPLCAH
ncbi:MAG TPA: STELLO glycosyltransferase family protein [Candidatus Limnocylindria bacterium]|nr:STELLO glycosyltransferase family protein [Candidatus Limnocylindria bacterium]